MPQGNCDCVPVALSERCVLCRCPRHSLLGSIVQLLTAALTAMWT